MHPGLRKCQSLSLKMHSFSCKLNKLLLSLYFPQFAFLAMISANQELWMFISQAYDESVCSWCVSSSMNQNFGNSWFCDHKNLIFSFLLLCFEKLELELDNRGLGLRTVSYVLFICFEFVNQSCIVIWRDRCCSYLQHGREHESEAVRHGPVQRSVPVRLPLPGRQREPPGALDGVRVDRPSGTSPAVGHRQYLTRVSRNSWLLSNLIKTSIFFFWFRSGRLASFSGSWTPWPRFRTATWTRSRCRLTWRPGTDSISPSTALISCESKFRFVVFPGSESLTIDYHKL